MLTKLERGVIVKMMQDKCDHHIKWNKIHRWEGDVDGWFIIGKCVKCDLDFNKEYIINVESVIDYDLDLWIPTDLKQFKQDYTKIS